MVAAADAPAQETRLKSRGTKELIGWKPQRSMDKGITKHYAIGSMAGQTQKLKLDEAGGSDSSLSMLPLLAIAGFSSVIAIRLCDAMLPALAAAFTVSVTDAAVVISAFAITYGAMQLVYGPLGDRFGKPRVIACATAGCALAALAAALSPSLKSLALARIAMGAAGAAIVPLALAWIGDTVAMSRRQEVLARYSSATVSGIMLGSWAGGFMTEMLGWRSAFFMMVPLYVVVAVLMWRKAGKPGVNTVAAAKPEPYLRQIRTLLSARWPQIVLLSVLLEASFTFGFLAFLPTVLHQRFAMSLSYGGAVLAVFGLGGLLFSRSASVLLRRMTPPVQARIGSILLAIGYGLLVWMPHWSWAIAGCLIAGFGFYTLHNTLQFSATQLSTTSRGLGMSTFACALFIGQSVGVVIASQIFERAGASWLFATAGMALTLIGLTFAGQLRKHAQRVLVD